MRLELNRRSNVPLYRQLAGELREQIVSGALAEGYRLPPERELAVRLEVNRTTVLQAYQQLKDEGLIASKVGKGTFVLPKDPSGPAVAGESASSRQAQVRANLTTISSIPASSSSSSSSLAAFAPSRGSIAISVQGQADVTMRGASPESAEPTVIRPPWSVLFSDYSNRFTYHDIASAERAQQSSNTVIDFATGSPNPADIPDDLLRRVSLEAFASHEFDGQPESPIEGFPELRELLADHMRSRGVHCRARNVMVLSGSEQGIDLIVRAFVNPGDCVLVEQSTFFPALQSFRSADARIIGVPMDGHGMRTDLLEGYCARFRPKLIYTVPTFQNPTGTVMPLNRRRELIEVARRYQCLIVEDDAYGELWYGPAEETEADDASGFAFGPVPSHVQEDMHEPAEDAALSRRRPVPLAGMENEGYVMYLSTFSKTVTSGLRTGWIVADPHVIGRLAALRRMVDQHTSTSSQRICLELLKEGRIAEHVRALVVSYRRRRDTAVAVLRRYASDGMDWIVPEGGYYIWVSLPEGVRSLDVLAACRAQGVTFMPGGVFDVDEMDDSHLRLNFVRPDAVDIERGIRAICGIIREALR
ncbi:MULTISPECIES: PLP-dependent aminotransferase family protein [unclassified Bifidobacterium]|uniref:aminotransferase-like domain-containing protein n=1 Tax=unclassified Bifidobacterium TaxID=2608897 RepID=UPI0011279E49|nr:MULTISPECIES: PLP-dependent aminotransferase family protein [unclassified Bifidobacterium]TPF79933.1 GntR family transcriptional regulator [Bifidobacterium sp. UTCIF-24]TPF83700.1 GntR family transcriptional regulator [Bifidobacterium sp. UTCIF-36]TPF88685.1 GntR family transcriptional regulator [Bifidobacterium sp. UTBIF-56]TPF93732.1 GntR family transcriptional regulator [Bifidobacterium sp. UTBIF-68]